MKVYTREGDGGMTALYGGGRVSKSDMRVRAYGTVDEVQAALGVCRAFYPCKDILDIQKKLFVLSAELAATPDAIRKLKERINADDVLELERIIDMNSTSNAGGDKFEFKIPGDSKVSAFFHVARTVTRRAEREVCTLFENSKGPHNVCILQFLNRLSDLLFVWSMGNEERGMRNEE